MEGMVLVKEIMTKNVKTANPETTLRQAIVKMNKFSIGCLVVVAKKKPIGIVTERDILRVVEQGLDLSEVNLSQVMSHPLVTITEDSDSSNAARLMARKQVKKLPVVKQGELVGIITTMDMVRSRPTLMRLFDAVLMERS